MPKRDHMLISDELLGWIEETADEARVGRMMRLLAAHWQSGGAQVDVQEDMAEVFAIFAGQLDGFRDAVARAGGMDASEKREAARRRVANHRARRAGKPEPYPVTPVTPVTDVTPCNACNADVTPVTPVTDVTPCNACNADVTPVTPCNNATQRNANQTTCASAPARASGGAPISIKDARTIGAAAGLPRAEVDAWWDYYESLDWAPSAKSGPNARMSRDAAVASLRKWQRNRAHYGDSGKPRRSAAQRPASAIRDTHPATAAEQAASEAIYGI